MPITDAKATVGRPADLDPSHDPRHFDGSSVGSILDISQNWLISGDDAPGYSSPQLDDSGWHFLSGSKPLSNYGVHDRPIVWYRLHVQVPASDTDLSIALQGFRGSYEAYVNGVLVGHFGRMTEGGSLAFNPSKTFMRIPPAALSGGNLVIAIRAAIGRSSSGEQRSAGFSSAFLGASSSLRDSACLDVFREETATGLILMLQSFALVVLLALAIVLRDQREYLALATSLTFGVAGTLLGFEFVRQAIHITFTAQNLCNDVLFVLQMLTYIEFFRLVAGFGSKWFRVMEVSLLAFGFAVVVHDALYGVLPDRLEASGAFPIFYLVTTIPYLIGLPGLLWASWIKRRSYDAALLLLPVTLFCGYYGVRRAWRLLSLFHVARAFPEQIPGEYLHASWGDLVDIVVTLILLVYIILRVVRTLRGGARYAAEIQAAQTVQQVLLSRSTKATPGFHVETVYLPASEVGGDFFFVSPDTDGSLVAIVGDVAGKGMLAAMRVSVILGALYREEARLPGVILERLNEAMLRQGDMGMTTACCIRIERSGRFTVANAGHISPYIGGKEVTTIGALPIGVISGMKYEETKGYLRPGEQLVLMSDGVVEARSSQSELFGFERLGPLTEQPANEIAETARVFGQEDDITVLTVECAG
jgi:hypothetical protein